MTNAAPVRDDVRDISLPSGTWLGVGQTRTHIVALDNAANEIRFFTEAGAEVRAEHIQLPTATYAAFACVGNDGWVRQNGSRVCTYVNLANGAGDTARNFTADTDPGKMFSDSECTVWVMRDRTGTEEAAHAWDVSVSRPVSRSSRDIDFHLDDPGATGGCADMSFVWAARGLRNTFAQTYERHCYYRNGTSEQRKSAFDLDTANNTEYQGGIIRGRFMYWLNDHANELEAWAYAVANAFCYDGSDIEFAEPQRTNIYIDGVPIWLAAPAIGVAAPMFATDMAASQSWNVGGAIAGITVPAATGTPTPTYSAAGLPAGISFNETTRRITGTPTAVGSGNIVVTATNSEGTDTYTVPYVTSAALAAPQFASATGPSQAWTTNTPITTISVASATGNPTPTYTAAGLPDGITFNNTNLQISGTPTAVGNGSIIIRATNSQGEDTWEFTYTITAGMMPGLPTGTALYNSAVAHGGFDYVARMTWQYNPSGRWLYQSNGADGTLHEEISQTAVPNIRDVNYNSSNARSDCRWRSNNGAAHADWVEQRPETDRGWQYVIDVDSGFYYTLHFPANWNAPDIGGGFMRLQWDDSGNGERIDSTTNVIINHFILPADSAGDTNVQWDGTGGVPSGMPLGLRWLLGFANQTLGLMGDGAEHEVIVCRGSGPSAGTWDPYGIL